MPTPLNCRQEFMNVFDVVLMAHEWNRHSCLYELLSPQTAAPHFQESAVAFCGEAQQKAAGPRINRVALRYILRVLLVPTARFLPSCSERSLSSSWIIVWVLYPASDPPWPQCEIAAR